MPGPAQRLLHALPRQQFPKPADGADDQGGNHGIGPRAAVETVAVVVPQVVCRQAALTVLGGGVGQGLEGHERARHVHFGSQGRRWRGTQPLARPVELVEDVFLLREGLEHEGCFLPEHGEAALVRAIGAC